MRYKCVTCGIEFDNIEQLATHKRQHQASSGNSPGVICLGCGKGIPLGASRTNYSEPLICPNCQRTMTVVIENGEVCGSPWLERIAIPREAGTSTREVAHGD